MSLDFNLKGLDPKMREKYFPPVQTTRIKWDHELDNYARDDDGELIRVPFEEMNPRLEAIIFACMSTGIGVITEKNYREMFYRYLRASGYTAVQKIDWLDENDSTENNNINTGLVPYLTMAHFMAAIGLRTNVANETAAAFAARMKKRENA